MITTLVTVVTTAERFSVETNPGQLRGPPGKDGVAIFQRIAGETLSALTAVYEIDGDVFALDANDADHIDLLSGVTLTATTSGQSVDVQRVGAIDDPGWSWALGCVWLGSAGRLTQVPPSDGYDLLIGYANSATRITLNIQDPINLE